LCGLQTTFGNSTEIFAKWWEIFTKSSELNIVIKFRHVYVLQRFCKIKGKLPVHLEIENFCSHADKIFYE